MCNTFAIEHFSFMTSSRSGVTVVAVTGSKCSSEKRQPYSKVQTMKIE